MRVAGGGAQAVVAEQDLNDTDVGAGLQQMGCETVAQRMGGESLGQPTGVAGALHGPLQTLQAEGTVGRSANKEPGSRMGNSKVAT